MAFDPELAALLLSRFRGRADHCAVADPKGFHPQPLKSPMQPGWMRRHLEGGECLGFYLMTPESCVFCSCVDFDNKPEHPDPEWRDKTAAVHTWLGKAGLSPATEVSASGNGAHVWLFFEEACPAWVVRSFWRLVEEKVCLTFKEVYPRQDELSGKGMGSLVRYPLWNHSHFVDPENEWATIPSADALKVAFTSAAELKTLAYEMGRTLEAGPRPPATSPLAAGEDEGDELSPRVKDRLARKGSLLERRWNGDATGMKDDSRSALVLSIACELVRQIIPTPEVTAAVRRWCLDNDYPKGLEDRALSRCIGMAYEYVNQRNEERSKSATIMRDACMAYIDGLERDAPRFTPSGLAELDASIDGIGWGEMCVLAGRPGHGKSAFALQWMDTAALQGMSGLILSEEMSAVSLGGRALTYLSELEASEWSKDTAPLLRADVDRHYKARAPIYVVENCHTIDRAEEVIDEFVKTRGVRMVVVDYVQLIRGRGLKRYEQVTDVSTRLKQSAGRHGVAMIAVCQMNREVDHRKGYEPELADLKDTGQLEQDADLVLFVQWPRQYDKSADPDMYLVYAKKRRNGPVRKVRIETTFNAERQKVGGRSHAHSFDPFAPNGRYAPIPD